MLASGPWYASGSFYGAASLIAIVVFGALTVWVTYKVGATKRQLTYSLVQDTSLLAATRTVARRDLKVLYLDEELAEPRVLEVRLASRGRRDIRSEDFDQERPLVLDVGIRIVALLAITNPGRRSVSPPPVGFEGTSLRITPFLIPRRLIVSFTVLADGASPLLTASARSPTSMSDRRLMTNAPRLRIRGGGGDGIFASAIALSFYLSPRSVTRVEAQLSA